MNPQDQQRVVVGDLIIVTNPDLRYDESYDIGCIGKL